VPVNSEGPPAGLRVKRKSSKLCFPATFGCDPATRLSAQKSAVRYPDRLRGGHCENPGVYVMFQ
jgi:hypothetical protein